MRHTVSLRGEDGRVHIVLSGVLPLCDEVIFGGEWVDVPDDKDFCPECISEMSQLEWLARASGNRGELNWIEPVNRN
jgi:hypothetical protein